MSVSIPSPAVPPERCTLRTLAWAVCCVLALALLPAPAGAQDAAPKPSPNTMSVGTGRLTLPEGWTHRAAPEFRIASMPAQVGVALSLDRRVSVYLLVIDPFGVDLGSWKFEDLLAPTLLDLLSFTGADDSKMRVRQSSCALGEHKAKGRLIILPVEEGQPRLVAGLACGFDDVSRWAVAFVVVEAGYDRPLLLRQSLRQANALLESFSFF